MYETVSVFYFDRHHEFFAMSNERCWIDLDITHGTLEACEFSELFPTVPARSWSVGERRATPKGDLLKGVRDYTYVTYNIGVADGPEDALELAFGFIEGNEISLSTASAMGAALLLQIWDRRTSTPGFSLSPEQIVQMAKLGMSLEYGFI